jgi:hypothetical protein
MTLQPGCRFVVAPHFHLTLDWPQRVLIGAGVVEDEGRFIAQQPWRTPTADELSLMVLPLDQPISGDALEDILCLFQLPEHLLSAWWSLLGQSAEALGVGQLAGFDAFANQVAEFLAFKELPMPPGVRCDVVVSDVEQQANQLSSKTNRNTGFYCNLAPWTPWPWEDEHAWPRQWGGINLGDEHTAITLINLPCAQLAKELRRLLPYEPEPATVSELMGRFLRLRSDYPPVRLILKPGEGFQLPQGGLILGHCFEDKREADVLLVISRDRQLAT